MKHIVHIFAVAVAVAWLHVAAHASDDGWTTLDPIPDQRIVYVDKTGGNNATGVVYTWTQGHPQTGDDPFNPPQQSDPNDKIKAFETVNAAYNALTSPPGGWPTGGAPGWILLKRGENWSGEGMDNFHKFGPSSGDGWLLFGAYVDPDDPSDDRPIVSHFNSSTTTSIDDPLHRLAIVGLEVLGENGVAIRIVRNGDGLHIEDVLIPPGRNNGINIQRQHDDEEGVIFNVTLRRNVIYGRYPDSGTGHVQGTYISGVDGLVVEECVYWHNGWEIGVDLEECIHPEECAPDGDGCPTIRNHNVYLDCGATNVTFSRNITADGSSHGCQQRRGGINDNNLYMRNANGLNWGHANCDWDSQTPASGEVATGSVTRNVFLDGRDILPCSGLERAHGMWVRRAIDSVIEQNLLAHQVSGSSGRAMTLQGNLIDLTLSKNTVYRWVSDSESVHTLRVDCTDPTWENILIQNNEFQQVANTILVEHQPSLAEFTYSANVYHPTTGTPFRLSGTCGSLVSKSFTQWVTEVESNAISQEVNYSDPSRDIWRYLDEETTITPGSDPITEFMLEAIQQSRTNWREEFTAPRVNCYMRDGFDMNVCYDLTGDNSVGVADLLELLACWGPVASGCEDADLDDDGDVGVSDLLILLANWGDCDCPGTRVDAQTQDCLDRYEPGTPELEECLEHVRDFGTFWEGDDPEM